MAKKITVKTVKASNKVEIAPDASGPAPLAAPVGSPLSEAHQNPFDAVATGGGEKYTWAAIVALIATLLTIGIVVIEWMEWDFYHGGFNPVFLKEQPGMGAPVAPSAPTPSTPAPTE